MLLGQQLIIVFLVLLSVLMDILLHGQSILHMLHSVIRGCGLQSVFVSHFLCFTMKRVTLQMGFAKCYSWNQTFISVVGLQGVQCGRDPSPATSSCWLVLM